MRITSIFYFLIALFLIIFLGSLAIPFLSNLAPGAKLVYTIFPVTFLLLTHFTPAEIIQAFRLAGRKSGGKQSEYRQAILFFQTAQQLFFAIMLLGLVAAFIWTLGSPKPSQSIAHFAAIVIGAFFYPALFIFLICIPCKSAVQKRLAEIGEQK